MADKKEKPKSSREPSVRQKKLAKELSENIGTPMGKAMRKVGYSKEYSENPKLLTTTKSWQDLMEEYLPDSLLAEKHNALLSKEDDTGQVDTVAVGKGLDLAYKIKGKLAPEQVEHTIRAYKELSDEELEKLYEEKTNRETTE